MFVGHDPDALDDHIVSKHGGLGVDPKIACQFEGCSVTLYPRALQRHLDYAHNGGVYPDPGANLPAKPVRGVSTCDLCLAEGRPDVYKVSIAAYHPF